METTDHMLGFIFSVLHFTISGYSWSSFYREIHHGTKGSLGVGRWSVDAGWQVVGRPLFYGAACSQYLQTQPLFTFLQMATWSNQSDTINRFAQFLKFSVSITWTIVNLLLFLLSKDVALFMRTFSAHVTHFTFIIPVFVQYSIADILKGIFFLAKAHKIIRNMKILNNYHGIDNMFQHRKLLLASMLYIDITLLDARWPPFFFWQISSFTDSLLITAKKIKSIWTLEVNKKNVFPPPRS